MWIKANLLFLALLLGSGGSAPLPSTGRVDCINYRSFDEKFGYAAAGFEARVIAVDWIPGRECCHALSGWATVQTERWWKGEPVRELKLGAAGQIFKVAERYVIFGFGKPLAADGCNKTRPIHESGRVLEWLAKKPSNRAS
jgi:hypothetical protein